ncbi:aminoglycoside phosphotransferase family protein [Maridesulfovibrio sp.]|uniref:aminoglycoside phosphotransferase family protein n=1 Tax=Maridesulfovibrio sp. TaxID=2795000 RepID=UPI002AA8C7A8|nr:aminoglycoside phosphotransferase family protein [Maridesulfovibrio sp.]
MLTSDPESLVRNLTGELPINTERIRAGRNSRVFRVDCKSGQSMLAKFYLHPTADGRSRLEQEWTALQFMTESGLSNVPAPLAFDESVQGAVFSFIKGDRIENGTDQDLREIISFLSRLHELSGRKKALALPRAAEACFSPAELIKNITQRLKKLQALPTEGKSYRHLHTFLKDQFSPQFETCINDVKTHFAGRLWTEPLAMEFRTLSPSDFGFHNAIKNGQKITFVDFEYFGWDDPVKATADFLLHPAMNLSGQQMAIFFADMKKFFMHDENFILRFKKHLPLFRLKWAVILLNEFLSQHLEQREFSCGKITNPKDRLTQQLEKAENILNKDQKILHALDL